MSNEIATTDNTELAGVNVALTTTDNTELAGVNVALMGPAGSGKTFAIGTLVDAGLEVFYLALESGIESLHGYYKDAGKPIPPNLHWHVQAPPKASFAELMDSAQKINTLSLESIAKMQDPNRSKHNQFYEIIGTLNNFPDDRTGESFGAVDDWDTSRVLVMDGLTGLGRAAMSLVIGGKPVKSQSDWGIAQDQVEKLLRMVCDNCKCHFVLIAHIERETDQVLGGVKIMVSTLGQKLAPKIPTMFSDVILATRQGNKWTWDTSNVQADLKTRNLEYKGDLSPNFKPIIEKWKARQS